ncbi:DUF1996 domain-containing protein [Streptomyces sp. NPDC093094]|uniref:DUF1996 domain-containing protein n=1 Tax=Streptomyces sp. NPDC093094 TaxID=3366026 RepID=UPI0038200BD2
MLGGGGLVAVNVYASATDGGADGGSAWGAATIDCPDVGEQLTSVPDQAREEVDKELAQLDQQIADAYKQLQDQTAQGASGSPEELIVQPLNDQRAGTIDRIGSALDNAGDRPEGLDSLAACTLRQTEGTQEGEGDGQQNDGGQDGGQNDGGQQDGGGQDDGGQQGNGGQAGNGPVAADYQDITSVQPNAGGLPQGDGASTGTFTSSCGVNAEGLFNSDNVIVAPGVTNGAHHFHDYIGNQANDAFASDDDLAAAGTSCVDQGDKSSYYWPVVRLQNGTQEQDAQSPGGGIEGNAGEIVTPKEVTLTFVGSQSGEVTAMPRLMRIITGDAKAFVNGPGNANASWSCTGFEDRQLKDKYPLCPSGSDVVRTFKFQSCWDGRNIDSANHRTHVAFADGSGNCPGGFQAIPQLVQRIVYDVDAPSLDDGGRTTPLFAVDSFPEQLHKPVTDHGDFINVFDEGLMGEMVDCINSGRQCGAGGGDNGGDTGGGDNGGDNTGGGDNGGNTGGGDNAGDTGGGDNGGDNTGGGDNGGNTGGGDNAGNTGGGDNGGNTGGGDNAGDTGGGDNGGDNTGGGDNGGNTGGGDNGGDNTGGNTGGGNGGEQPSEPNQPGDGAGQPAEPAEPGDGSGGAGEPSEAPRGEDPAAPAVNDPNPVQPKSANTANTTETATTSGGTGTGTGAGDTSGAVDTSGNDGAGASDAQQAAAPQGGSGPLAETGANLWPAAAGSALLIAGGFLLMRTRRRAAGR